tara:strand:+ start:520 stop:762 length:243 start_codon:yes stop_codon:yes gene_type:complete
MRRTITHGRQAGEKLARRWFREAGVPPHVIGFSADVGFYLIVHCMAGGRIYRFPVPCWGARVLRHEVDAAIREFNQSTRK